MFEKKITIVHYGSQAQDLVIFLQKKIHNSPGPDEFYHHFLLVVEEKATISYIKKPLAQEKLAPLEHYLLQKIIYQIAVLPLWTPSLLPIHSSHQKGVHGPR